MFCFLLLAAKMHAILKIIITVHRSQHIHWKNLPIYSCRKYLLSNNGLRKLKSTNIKKFNILFKNKYNPDKLFISIQYGKYQYGAVSVRLFIYTYMCMYSILIVDSVEPAFSLQLWNPVSQQIPPRIQGNYFQLTRMLWALKDIHKPSLQYKSDLTKTKRKNVH